MTTNKALATKLLTKLSTEQVATCTITGIAITISIPAVEGFALEYISPFSYKSNIYGLARLPTDKLLGYEPAILAGVLLGLYQHLSLLSLDKTDTAAACNVLLQSIPIHTLSEVLSFFAFLPTDKTGKPCCDYLPKLHICTKDSCEGYKSSIKDLVYNHAKSCREIIYPVAKAPAIRDIEAELEMLEHKQLVAASKGVPSTLAAARIVAQKTAQRTFAEAMRTARELLTQLKDAVSSKLYSNIKVLLTGEFILDADIAFKEALATALKVQIPKGDKLHDKAVSLANAILTTTKHKQEEDVMDFLSDSDFLEEEDEIEEEDLEEGEEEEGEEIEEGDAEGTDNPLFPSEEVFTEEPSISLEETSEEKREAPMTARELLLAKLFGKK